MSISGVPDEFEELMPCPACPDGYVWNGNGPTRKLCPVCKGLAAVGYRAAQTEQTSGGTQQRAERAEAERDALREVVRAADAIWKTVSQTPDRTDAMAAYFTARAKVKP